MPQKSVLDGVRTRVYIASYMPGIRNSRFLTFGGLVIAFCAVAGGFWGRSALVAQDQIPDQYKVFTSALGAIEENYVGDYESDRLVYSAISGLLQTLDPHSSFMDPRSFAQMRERQEGRYYGLGITINVVDGDVTIFNVFEGSPATPNGQCFAAIYVGRHAQLSQREQ